MRGLSVASILIIATVLTGCAHHSKVRLDMTEAQVIEILGEPDRRAILMGKILQDIDSLDRTVDPTRFRLMYFYSGSGVQVWFSAGRVTGMTKNGAQHSGESIDIEAGFSG